MLKQQLAGIKQRFDAAISQDLAAFNRLLRERNIPNVITRTATQN